MSGFYQVVVGNTKYKDSGYTAAVFYDISYMYFFFVCRPGGGSPAASR